MHHVRQFEACMTSHSLAHVLLPANSNVWVYVLLEYYKIPGREVVNLLIPVQLIGHLLIVGTYHVFPIRKYSKLS